MKKSIYYLLVVFILNSFLITAQQVPFVVKGQVADSLSLEPEIYATIRVFKQSDKTKEVTAFVSDSKGIFSSKLEYPGAYKLLVTSVGRAPIVRDFELSEHYPVKDFGQLLIKDDVKQLAEVSIVAAKPLMKAEVDKTTYSVEDDPDSETNTMLEILRKVPLVTLDGDDNIKVNGSSSFKVYMNGKPSNMISDNPKEVLRSIPASTIRKVEVITDPGARYDAEGVSGILNIITKGVEFEGYNGNLGASYMTSGRYRNIYGFLMLQYGKFSMSANYTLGEHKIKSTSDYYRHQLNTSDEVNLFQHHDSKSTVPSHYASLESSYELDSMNLIILSGSLNYGHDKARQNGMNCMTDAEERPVYSYTQAIYQDKSWGNGSVKADYQHLFKRNKGEILTLSYQFDYLPNDLDYLSQVSDKEGDSPSLQYLYNYSMQSKKAHKNEHTLQLDYVNPFLPEHLLEGGLKYIRRHNKNNSTSVMKEKEEEEWRPSEVQPILDYNHAQNIMAAYCGYTFKRKRFGINTGLRMEHLWQDVKFYKGDGDDFGYQATDWVPSFSTSYKLNERDLFKLAYNLRIRRPDISRLNPYVQIEGPNMTYGNSGMTSEKHNRFTFTFSHFASKLNMQAAALYTLGRNVIGRYQFLDDQGMFHSTYGNVINIKGGGVSGYLGYTPFPNTTLSVNGMINYLDIRAKKGVADVLEGLRSSGFSESVFVDVSQRFKYGWRVTVSGAYMRSEVSLGKEPFTYYYYGVGLIKTFIKDKLSVVLRAQDCFAPYLKYTINEKYNDYTSVLANKDWNRTFGISVSYRFGDLKTNVKKAMRSIHNDDLLKKENSN